MDKSVIKPVLFGVLFGALAYAAPFFLLKAVFFFAIIGALFRFFAWRKFGRHGSYQFTFADNIRNMSQEEYDNFKSKYQNHCGYKKADQSSLNTDSAN